MNFSIPPTQPKDAELQKLDALLAKLSTRPSPALTPKQTRLLELHRTVQENELSLALLNAWNNAPAADDNGRNASQQDVDNAQQALLLARAQHTIATLATTQAITADPVLRAVHGSTDEAPATANSPGQDIVTASAVSHRDALSMILSTLKSKIFALEARTRDLEYERRGIWTDLPPKAKRAVELSKDLDPELEMVLQGEEVEPEWKARLERADQEVKRARWEYRVIKGVASGLVAGSGVDWAGDDKLINMVLEDE